MINVIEGGLAIIGGIVIVFLVIALTQEAIDRCRILCLQWKFHGDAANQCTRRIKELEERMDRLNSEIEFLQGDIKELQPKKAKSK